LDIDLGSQLLSLTWQPVPHEERKIYGAP